MYVLYYNIHIYEGYPKRFATLSLSTLVKIKSKFLQLFLWLIFNVPAAHAPRLVKMVWYGDVHFKQRAVTEFLVAEKESVMNMHKGLKNYTVSMLLIKALLVVVLHELQVLRKTKRSSVTRVAHACQQQLSLRRCCNLLMNSTHYSMDTSQILETHSLKNGCIL
jgi:hypothetical protein